MDVGLTWRYWRDLLVFTFVFLKQKVGGREWEMERKLEKEKGEELREDDFSVLFCFF